MEFRRIRNGQKCSSFSGMEGGSRVIILVRVSCREPKLSVVPYPRVNASRYVNDLSKGGVQIMFSVNLTSFEILWQCVGRYVQAA